jgi:catechol 2,3-dioxygenase-like lactoylglutathione lyase family enzyme
MKLHGIDHVALSVHDVEQAAQWYCDVLGLERQHQGAWNGVPTFIGRGSTGIALFPSRKAESGKQSEQKRRGMLHLAFRADAKNFAVAQAELRNRGIHFQFQDHQISHSIYFRDIDGHELEITTYEI